MATPAEWAKGYARQADADFKTFMEIQALSVPRCHVLQFLHMACEKLVKAHLCQGGADLVAVQSSHAYIAKHLPRVLEEQMRVMNHKGSETRQVLGHARRLALEIDVLAPAVRRGGQRPDNCEYPWEDDGGTLHVPLDWSFQPLDLIKAPSGRTFPKLIRAAIDRLLQ